MHIYIYVFARIQIIYIYMYIHIHINTFLCIPVLAEVEPPLSELATAPKFVKPGSDEPGVFKQPQPLSMFQLSGAARCLAFKNLVPKWRHSCPCNGLWF